MSSIDKRIVEMQFENSQFEKGVRQTMKSIEDLEDSLQFEKAEKGLNNLKRVGDSFSLAHMADGIDAVTEKFSALGVIGKRVLENLTDSAMNWGKSFVSSMSIDQVSAGFDKYDTKVRSTKTIMNATGKDIGYVNEQLDRLNWFTDETSYSYGDMVSNIGKFTSMGIDLESSVTSMQGIATWAALSGQGAQEASRAMYNMTQAMGTGKVALIDWKSIENANMATKEFKQTAIDTAKSLGILNAQGKTAKGTLVTYENFSQTLKEGWFTSDVLLKTLDKYGSAADEIYKYATEHNMSAAQAIREMGLSMDDLGVRAFLAAQEARTFKDAIDATKDAVSTGWMRTFEYIFGNVEQATLLFTEFTEVLYELFAAGGDDRNDLLAAWTDQEIGGRADLIQGLMDVLWGLVEVVNIVKDAFHALIPQATVETLQNISVAVKEFGASFREAVTPFKEFTGVFANVEHFHYEIPNPFEEFEGEMKKGSKSEAVRLMQERLMKLGYELDRFGADGIWGPETQAAYEKWQRENEMAVTGVYDAAAHAKMGELLGLDNQEVKVVDGYHLVEETIERLPPKAQKFKDVLTGIFSALHIVWNVLATGFRIIGHIINLLSPLGEAFLTIGSAIGQSVTAFDKWLTESGTFNQWFESAKKFLEPFGEWVKFAADALLRFFGLTEDTNEETMTFVKLYSNIKEAIKKTGIIDKLSAAWDKFKKAFSGVVEIIKKRWGIFKNTLGEGSKGFLDSLPDTIAKVVEWLGNLVSKGLDLISPFIAKIPSAVEKIKNFWAALTQKGDSATGQAPGFLIKVRDAFKSVIDFLFGDGDLNSGKQPGILRKAWQLITGNLEAFTEGMDEETKKSVLEKINSVKEFFQKIGEALFYFFGGELGDSKKLSDEAIGKIDEFKKSIGKVLEAVAILFTGNVKENSALSKDAIDKIIKIRNTIGGIFTAIWEFLTGIFGTVKGLLTGEIKFDSIGEFFKSLWESLKTLFQNISGIASENLGATWENIKKFFSSLWDNLLKFGKWIVIGYAVYKVIKFIGSLTGVFYKLKEVIGSYKKNAQALSKTILEFAGAIALIAGSIWLIAQLKPEQLKQGVLAIGGIVVVFGIFLAVSSFFTKDKAKAVSRIGQTVWDFAKAIGVLAATVIILSFIPWDRFINGLIKVIIMLAVMTHTIKKIAKMSQKYGTNTIKMEGLIGMAVAIGILALVVALMGHYKWETLGKGLLGLGVIIFMLRGLMKTMGKWKVEKVPKGLFSLTILIGVLAIIVAELGKLDIGTLGKGLLAIIVIMVVIRSVIKSMGKIGKPNVGGLIATILMIGLVMAGLVVALQYVKDIDYKVILAFSLGISALLVAVGIFAKLSSGATFAGVTAAALGLLEVIAVISLVIAAFGALSKVEGFNELMTSGAAIIGDVIGTFISHITANIAPNSVNAFGEAMKSISGLPEADPEGVQNAVDNAGLLKTFADSLPTKDVWTTLVEGLVGNQLTQFSRGMGEFGKAFNTFATQINEIETWEGLEDKTTTAITIAESIRDFSATLPEKGAFDRIVDAVGASELQNFSRDMSTFGTEFNKFATQINAVETWEGLEEKATTATTIAGVIRDFSATLPEKGAFDRIVDSLGASELQNFSRDMTTFGAEFNKFATQINAVETWEGLEEKATTATTIAGVIRDFSATLPKKGTFDKLVERLGASELANFSRDTSTFGTEFNKFAEQINAVGTWEGLEDKTKTAVTIAGAIRDFGTTLPEQDVIKSVLGKLGMSELQNFSRDMGSFGSGFNQLASEMSTIEYDPELETQITDAIKIATKVAEFIDSLSGMSIEGKKEGILAWFQGDTKQETVFDNIGDLAESMKTSSESFSGLSTGTLIEDVGAAIAAAQAVAEFLAYISSDSFNIEKQVYDNNSGFYQSTFDVLKDRLTTLGASIQQFSIDTKGVDLPAVSSAITSVTDFLKLITEGPDNFSENGIMSFLSEENVATTLASIVTSISTQFNDAGINLATALSDGMGTADITGGTDAAKNMLDSVNDYKNDFDTAGRNFALGLSNGVAFRSYAAVRAAETVARQMVNAARRVFNEHSPSKVTEQIGEYFTEGLAIGTTNKVGEATNAAADVADSMLSTASGTLSTLSSLLADDIDVNPVIAPVVDLTNARQSAAMIGGLFGNQSFGVTSQMMATRAMDSTVNGRPVTIQNGTLSTTESLGGVSDQLNALASYLTARNDGPHIDEMQSLSERFGDLADAVSNLKIVLDTGTLVGEITPALDVHLGSLASRRDRGN